DFGFPRRLPESLHRYGGYDIIAAGTNQEEALVLEVFRISQRIDGINQLLQSGFTANQQADGGLQPGQFRMVVKGINQPSPSEEQARRANARFRGGSHPAHKTTQAGAHNT